jgi:hypothetical protein
MSLSAVQNRKINSLNNYGTKSYPLFLTFEVAKMIDDTGFFMSYRGISPSSLDDRDYYMTLKEVFYIMRKINEEYALAFFKKYMDVKNGR